MFTLIKGASVYTPDPAGKKDVLMCMDKIAAIDDSIGKGLPGEVEVVDGRGKLLVPGFIDQHVHISGGGGEGGFSTRTPEIDISKLVEAGITTVVGILGTDGVTRHLYDLYAKAKSLEHQGISTYIYTGSYQVPPVTFTGSVQRDLVIIDKVVGVGEIAISDHRSSEPSFEELTRLATQARTGGLISGKAGIVHLHLGDHPRGLGLILRIVNETAVPATQFIPTHVNRTTALFKQAIEFAGIGGRIDVTAGFEGDDSSSDCVPAWEALAEFFDCGMDEGSISMSSDGNGSLPVFDNKGNLVGMEIGDCKVLLSDFKTAVLKKGIPLEKALKAVTINPARILKIDDRKGTLYPGKDADCILMDEELNIDAVFAKGKRVVAYGHMVNP